LAAKEQSGVSAAGRSKQPREQVSGCDRKPAKWPGRFTRFRAST
jgi:hypothetical protein